MPKKPEMRSRHQSRRAASKEALKQMQILLGDEDDDPVEIPDDEEVVPAISPPKKKYKLTHRKSSDGNDRDVIVLKSITPSITNHYVENNLELECWVEELEPCQKTKNQNIQSEEEELQNTLNELVTSCNGEVIYKGEYGSAIEVKEQLQKTVSGYQNTASQSQNIILNNSINNTTQSYQLVMDPRLGLFVGTVPTQTTVQTATKAILQKPLGKVQVAKNLQSPKMTTVTPVPSRETRGRRGKGPHTQPAILAPKISGGKTPMKRILQPTATNLGGVKPTENNVEGGLSTGSVQKTKAVVDLTSDDGRPLPDSREISFNKLQGKTFPSLVVVARPHLRVIDVNVDRPKLDAKVKSVLMHAPTKFTEWLIQQGLVRSEQKCSIHSTTQLKLGMYSDVSKFPYSGGYVWISECCPQRFVSVFSGSLFEGSPHPPLVILKLLYHWACQTNIQNVTQWVKVDNLYVKGMYTWLRSVCTVALHSHIRQLGGPQTTVEVGVISLGTTSQDGNSRQVKVEVLGILETTSKLIRLRAVEPLADGDRNYKKRFTKILEPLTQWVHPSSIIVTDLTVDKITLMQMGFTHIVQSTSNDPNNSNRTVMEYLRRIVPRMFQNTLSLLSRQIIQQFLDELVWREWFGTTSLTAFENLVTHLAEQTRLEGSQSLIMRLNKVAMNPFKNWAIPTTNNVPVKIVDYAKKRKRKEDPGAKVVQNVPADANRPPKSNSPDVPEQMVPLENYYYGTIDHYPPKTNITLNMKCPFCKEMFNNNIVLMNHLFKHAHNVSKDGQMCRYCLTSVPTANDLLKHIATSHPSETKFDNGFVCLICETQYMNPFVLGKHMSKEHCPSELPYQCGTCGYRCSNHKQAIDHFYKQHDNGPTIQCPFCLKSTTVFSSSRNIVQNMNYFIQHLQKHQRKQFARRCGKCNLWFVQKEVIKDHQTRMHASQRGKAGLVPWNAPRNGVMVPKSRTDKYPSDAEVINFNTLHFKVSKNLTCKECNTVMDSPKHFPSFENCQNTNCSYSTCCTNAMLEHNVKCDKSSIPEEPLPYEMFCVCGYSNKDGNQLARHLAICERKSAYPSLGDAKTASVTHSMLDVLGLVRKLDETEKKLEKPKPEVDEMDVEDNVIPLEDGDEGSSVAEDRIGTPSDDTSRDGNSRLDRPEDAIEVGISSENAPHEKKDIDSDDAVQESSDLEKNPQSNPENPLEESEDTDRETEDEDRSGKDIEKTTDDDDKSIQDEDNDSEKNTEDDTEGITQENLGNTRVDFQKDKKNVEQINEDEKKTEEIPGEVFLKEAAEDTQLVAPTSKQQNTETNVSEKCSESDEEESNSNDRQIIGHDVSSVNKDNELSKITEERPVISNVVEDIRDGSVQEETAMETD